MYSGRQQVEIIALYEELGSYRAVGELIGCDHKTVKRYVELAGEAGQLAPVVRRARVTDDFSGLIADRVERSGGRVTARRLWRALQAAGYQGSERSLRRDGPRIVHASQRASLIPCAAAFAPSERGAGADLVGDLARHKLTIAGRSKELTAFH